MNSKFYDCHGPHGNKPTEPIIPQSEENKELLQNYADYLANLATYHMTVGRKRIRELPSPLLKLLQKQDCAPTILKWINEEIKKKT